MRLYVVFASCLFKHELAFPDVLPPPKPNHSDTYHAGLGQRCIATSGLPLPEGWRRHGQLLEEIGIPQPKNVHTFDRSVAWVVLLEDVVFDLVSAFPFCGCRLRRCLFCSICAACVSITTNTHTSRTSRSSPVAFTMGTKQSSHSLQSTGPVSPPC